MRHVIAQVRVHPPETCPNFPAMYAFHLASALCPIWPRLESFGIRAGVIESDQSEGGHAVVGAFSGCFVLGRITLPPNLTVIGRSAFSRCTSLSEITLLPNVAVIGEHAFFGCTSLSEITLPPDLAVIGECLLGVHVPERDHATPPGSESAPSSGARP